MAARDRLSQNLQKMDEPTRSAFLAQNKRIAPLFNADGTVKQEVWENMHSPQSAGRFSVETDSRGRQYVQADRKVLTGTDAKAWGEQITNYINEQIRKGHDIKIKTVEGDTLTITENTAGKAAFQNKGLNEAGYKTKLQAEAHIDELSQVSVAQKDHYGNKKIKADMENKHVKRNLAKDGWSYRNAYFKDFDGNEYKLTLSVAVDGTVESVYNVGKIEKHRPGESRLMPQRAADVSNNSIRENGVNVNSFSQKNAKTNSQTVGNFSGITYSSSLKGRENTLKYQPVAAEQATEHAKAALRNIELVSGGRVDVVLTDGANLTTADGRQANGEYADGVVYVNANADSYERAMFIASHELTHTLEGTGEYQRLGEFIKERVAADPALAKKYDLEKYRAAYANAQAGDFSAETLEYQAATEMYADFVAKEILGNEDVVRRLAAKQRNIAVRFLEWVRSAVRRLGGGRETQAEYKALKKAEKLLSAALENAKGGVTLEEVEEDVQTAKAVKAFFEGKGDSSATRQNDSGADKDGIAASQAPRNDSVEQKETTDEKSVDVGAESSARYSLSEGAEQAVENALADKNYGGEVKLTDVSPSILLGQEGVRNLPMMMKASHIRENIFTEKEAKAKGLKVDKNINYHGLGKTLFLKVIEDLDNVTEAYRGTKNADNPARREKYFLLISKQTDGNGNIINVPVYINEKGIYNRAFIDTNKIATVFGKDAIYSYIREQISKGNLVRIKKRNIQTSESTAPIAANYGKNVSTTIIRENSEKSTENAKKVEKTLKKSSRKSLDVEETEKTKRFDGYATALRNYLHRLNISEETKAERFGQKYVKTNQTLEKILCL